jgi:uncharacterized protein
VLSAEVVAGAATSALNTTGGDDELATAAFLGALGGLVLGYVLQRGQLCFHSAFRGVIERRPRTFKAWLLGAAVTAVGMALLDAVGPWSMSSALPLRPVNNMVGGVVFGVGMVVAASCVSGLFYKLGAGMFGALAGLVGWSGGELVARQVDLGGDAVLAGRETLPTLLDIPRVAAAGLILVIVAAGLSRTRRDRPARPWQWNWPMAGVALGLAATWTWIMAGAGGVRFGASTVGATGGLADGSPNWWLLAFLVGLVAGATIAARTAGGWWARGETRVRYAQLAVGGFLLGAGAQWAGGCNLGHGLSGMGQLNLSSMLVIASMITGVAVARSIHARVGGPGGPHQDPAYRNLTDGSSTVGA